MGTYEPFPAHERIKLAEEPRFGLGEITVIPNQRAVILNGKRRELQPRVMQVLVALAKARPEVVSRDRLVDLCWNGRVVGDDALNRVILSLRHLAQETAPQPFTIETVPRVGHRLLEHGEASATTRTQKAKARRVKPAIAAAILTATVAAIFLLLQNPWPWEDGRAPTVLVIPIGRDAPSRELARDVAFQLGSLQSVQPAPMRLIGEGEGASGKADLLLQVAPPKNSASVGASVVLTAGDTRTLLWSREFEQRSGSVAHLKQQIAFTAGRALGCAAEGLASQTPLRESDLKIYLNACVAMSDSMDDFRGTAQTLERLVQNSPRFVPGWALLINTELNAATDPRTPGGEALIPQLRRHIAAARKLEPHLAGAYIAEAVLLPQYAFVARGRLLDKAVAHNPQHAALRRERSLFLQAMGRNHDALMDAREAMKIDPLSAYLREDYVRALAIAGRMDAARQELRIAERIWPDARSVVGARAGFNLRWGDPREALRIVQTDDGPRRTPGILEPYLRARIDPSSKNIEEALRHGRMVLREVPGSIVMYSQLLAEFDRNEELFDILLNWRRMDIVGEVVGVLFRPAFADIHGDPRFMRAAHHLGLLNYWRTTGEWPDFCYAPDLPYNCKAEAAKIAANA